LNFNIQCDFTVLFVLFVFQNHFNLFSFVYLSIKKISFTNILLNVMVDLFRNQIEKDAIFYLSLLISLIVSKVNPFLHVNVELYRLINWKRDLIVFSFQSNKSLYTLLIKLIFQLFRKHKLQLLIYSFFFSLNFWIASIIVNRSKFSFISKEGRVKEKILIESVGLKGLKNHLVFYSIV